MERHLKSEAEEKPSPNWLELPREVTLLILEKLDAVEILESVQRVCTQWESICKEPSLWRTIIFINMYNSSLDLYSLFRQAVDRSCGDLIHLHITNCDTDVFLDYVTQRCTKIRRLQLVGGYTTDDGLCEAAKRLTLLEELEITYCVRVTEKALQKFGECCPHLKSLKINRERLSKMDDSEAMVIAKNMVELRHLQLFQNTLTNRGLKAILDSCSFLESLDLRRCFNLDLEQCSLGKRCTEIIKDFQGPGDDSDDDYGYYDTVGDHDFEATFYDSDEFGFYGDIYD